MATDAVTFLVSISRRVSPDPHTEFRGKSGLH